LRRISDHHKVSLATSVQAYDYLVQIGQIEARPKSGYFVLPWLNKLHRLNESDSRSNELQTTRPATTPTKVTVAQLAMSLVSEARQPGLVKLGAAVPGEDILPLGILSRTMAGTARRYYKAPAVYADAQGYAGLRRQIARLMGDSGCRCHADDIIITNGCLEAMSLALRVVANRGDTIAIESPTYFGVLQVIENLGMKALEVATNAKYGIDFTALNQALTKRNVKACVLMPSFNNPLGSCMSEDNKRDVVALLAQRQIPLIEDDVYGALSFDCPRPTSAKSYDDHGNVLYCSSFSKTVAPGLRLGWIIPGRYFEEVKYLKFLENISTAIHPQITMHEFIAKGSYRRYIRQSSAIYRTRMERLRHWVAEYFPEGTRMSDPAGGFILWLELAKQINSLELYRRAMEKRIAITPGILFSAQGQYQNHLRLSCGAVEGEKARKSVQILARILEEMLVG
jgi:DNA-binding transcriptional MocR family regulator